jgi:hypothetical protein
MILKNEDLINKLGSKESIDETELLRKINDRRFYVYVDGKPFKGFDSLSAWNDHLHFLSNDSIKYDLIYSYNVKTETDISVPFENCFNMSLVIDGETINISDYKTFEELVEIRKDVLSIGDFIRIHYHENCSEIDYTCTGTVYDITQNFIMISIPVGDYLRHINVFASDLLHNTIDVEIEILHKAVHPSKINGPFPSDDGDDDDDDDSPKYDVITEKDDE